MQQGLWQKSGALLGGLAILGSAVCFYLATVIVRLSQGAVNIDAAYFTFVRALFGFVLIGAIMIMQRQPFRPQRYDFLISRGIANLAAAYTFLKAVEVTTATEANILNMSYPVFVALFSWMFLGGKRDYCGYLGCVISFIGVLLVLRPGPVGVDTNQLWGLASGITASIAVLSLNLSRQENSAEMVLLFMFGISALILAVFAHGQMFVPNREEAFFLFTSALVGTLGQYLLTIGQKHISAVETSIISSTRIPIAALLGPVLTSDPGLSATGWIGALLIFFSNTGLALRKTTNVFSRNGSGKGEWPPQSEDLTS
jgi:drug/metabolite transporter (DMT)-like permease